MTTTEIVAETDQDLSGPVTEANLPEQATDTASAPPARPAENLELLYVNPKDLIIGLNVRTEVGIDKQMLADVKDRGVREIIPCRRNDERKLVVRKGQRRVMHAVEAGVPEVLVLVEPELISDETAREIDRVIDQFSENDKRVALTEADQARAAQKLLDLGLSAGQIVRRLHVPKKRVTAALAVAAHPAAMDAVSDGVLDLTQAAVIAEFGEDEEAVAELTEAARKRPERFDHLAQRLRDQREETQLREAAVAQLTAQGVTVIDRPESLYGGKTKELRRLRATPDTASGTELTAEQHATCPGNAAYLVYRDWQPVDQRVEVVYVCTDFQEHGHAERHTSVGVVTTGQRTGKMTEQEKAERRRVVKNNKEWTSAEKVRHTWLKGFVKRKTAPKDAQRWIVEVLAHGSHDMRKAMEDRHSLAIEWLGLATDDTRAWNAPNPIVTAAATANPARATMLTVAMLLAALDNGTSRQTWRSPTKDNVKFFSKLREWGYNLSEVEQLVLQPEKAAVEDEAEEVDADMDADTDTDEAADIDLAPEAELDDGPEDTVSSETASVDEITDDDEADPSIGIDESADASVTVTTEPVAAQVVDEIDLAEQDLAA